jgi:plastocyanin
MRMSRVVAVAVAAAAALAVAVAAAASDGSRHVRALDDCDPATFNATVGPGTCVGKGRTTFPDFVGQLVAKGSADGWAFKPSTLDLSRSRPLDVENRGGEFHTFTEVAQFGGGCVPFLNQLLGLTAVPECLPEVAPGVPEAFVTTGIDPDGTLPVAALSPGVHKFQCLIHPWMHTTVTVRARNNNDDD